MERAIDQGVSPSNICFGSDHRFGLGPNHGIMPLGPSVDLREAPTAVGASQS